MTSVDVGTLVHPGVILDRRTIEELTPPCEIIYLTQIGEVVIGRRPCDRPAEWAVRAHCVDCGANPVGLLCTPCIGGVTVWTCVCGGLLLPCGEPERLR